MEALAVRAVVHAEYVEIVFQGDIDPESLAGFGNENPRAIPAVMRHGRVLFDFSGVKRFGFDPLTLGDQMKRLSGEGLRLAICSNSPEFFGVGRQIAQFSGVEGEAIAVFHSRDEARAWLLGEGDGETA